MTGALAGLLALAVFFVALWLTGVLRSYALARGLLDIPNQRSSHRVATPRGGGVGIVVPVLMALPALGAAGAIPWPFILGLEAGGSLVALVGLADDRWGLPPVSRLAGHFTAAILMLWGNGGLPSMDVLSTAHPIWWAEALAVVLWLVWLLNLTNFMDGIDGIAAVEVITVSGSAAWLSHLAAPGTFQWLGPLVLAAAALGFLAWNWPPAKIFMGDSGSGFVGFMLGALSIQAAWVAPSLVWSWLILLGVFVVDATLTLLRRALRRERVYEAHRSHAYQHAASACESHLRVTLAVGATNLCWLFPIALAVHAGWIEPLFGVMMAYAPLVAIGFRFDAGIASAG